MKEAATGHVHWRTLAAVAERFLEDGCSLITSLRYTNCMRCFLFFYCPSFYSTIIWSDLNDTHVPIFLACESCPATRDQWWGHPIRRWHFCAGLPKRISSRHAGVAKIKGFWKNDMYVQYHFVKKFKFSSVKFFLKIVQYSIYGKLEGSRCKVIFEEGFFNMRLRNARIFIHTYINEEAVSNFFFTRSFYY